MTRPTGGGVSPSFIGIGAQKSGTTWLSRNLQAHPEIWMPPIKELHYFDEKKHDPPNPIPRLSRALLSKRTVDRRWRRQVRKRAGRHLKRARQGTFPREAFLWDLKYYAGRPTDGWYLSLFAPGEGEISGEITPAYSLLDRDGVAHVHRLMPDAKIVFMMRNPIERAWSQLVMGFDKAGKSLDAAGDEELFSRRFEGVGSRFRTDYMRTLENWGAYYPPERIFVGFLEDVHFFPEELLRRLYEFLGVDPSFEPPGLGRRVHSRSGGKMPASSAVYLAKLYRDEISRLSGRFGGYASFWRRCAGRLIEAPPEGGHVPYPLWESSLWEEWIGDPASTPGGPKFQGGPLSSVPT